MWAKPFWILSCILCIIKRHFCRGYSKNLTKLHFATCKEIFCSKTFQLCIAFMGTERMFKNDSFVVLKAIDWNMVLKIPCFKFLATYFKLNGSRNIICHFNCAFQILFKLLFIISQVLFQFYCFLCILICGIQISTISFGYTEDWCYWKCTKGNKTLLVHLIKRQVISLTWCFVFEVQSKTFISVL